MATKFERLYNDINDELTDVKDINILIYLKHLDILF